MKVTDLTFEIVLLEPSTRGRMKILQMPFSICSTQLIKEITPVIAESFHESLDEFISDVNRWLKTEEKELPK